jgi:hypothetical protein
MDNHYRTKDLSEGSVLLVKQQKLLSIDREGKTCWFIFEDKKSCEQIANQFWFGSCLVNAKSYFEAIQTLKNRIFSQ